MAHTLPEPCSCLAASLASCVSLQVAPALLAPALLLPLVVLVWPSQVASLTVRSVLLCHRHAYCWRHHSLLHTQLSLLLRTPLCLAVHELPASQCRQRLQWRAGSMVVLTAFWVWFRNSIMMCPSNSTTVTGFVRQITLARTCSRASVLEVLGNLHRSDHLCSLSCWLPGCYPACSAVPPADPSLPD